MFRCHALPDADHHKGRFGIKTNFLLRLRQTIEDSTVVGHLSFQLLQQAGRAQTKLLHMVCQVRDIFQGFFGRHVKLFNVFHVFTCKKILLITAQ